MALYTWLRKNLHRPNKKSVRDSNNLLKASQSARYIESYTMWPTAKIKPGVEINFPIHDNVENKLNTDAQDNNTVLEDKPSSLNVALLITK